MKLKTVNSKADTAGKLEALSKILAQAIDDTEDLDVLARLAKQYRDTVLKLAGIKGVETDDDDIGRILAEREAEGKPGAVR